MSTLQVKVGFVVLCLAAAVAWSAAAAPRYKVVSLFQSAAVGPCIPDISSGASTAVPNVGSYVVHLKNASIYCGFDTVTVPLDDISRATVYLEQSGAAQVARLEVCVRSLVTGAHTCGGPGYSATVNGTQSISASLPSGTFDGSYVGYLRLYIPKPQQYGYVRFLGFRLSKTVHVDFVRESLPPAELQRQRLVP